MFSAFSRYKREAYRHSEYAPKILAEEGIPVIMKVRPPPETGVVRDIAALVRPPGHTVEVLGE